MTRLQLRLQRAVREEAACKMQRGMRDNWPIIVDRDDTRVLSQNYSRTVARGWIQFGAASTLTGKKETKRERREGRTLKGLRRMRDPTEDWSLSLPPPLSLSLYLSSLSLLVFHQIYRIPQPCRWIVVPGNDLFSVCDCQPVPLYNRIASD